MEEERESRKVMEAQHTGRGPRGRDYDMGNIEGGKKGKTLQEMIG